MVKAKAVLGVVLLAGAAFAGAVNIGGYVQPRWEAVMGDEMTHTFFIRRAYLSGRGDVGECFSYKVLLSMPKAEVSLYDAYVDIKPFRGEYVALRVGQFQQPIGMEKLISSSSVLFPERSYASGFTIDRDIGAMLAGGYKFFKLQAGVFNGAGRNRLDDNDAKDITARLTLKPLDFIHVGGAYQMGTRTTVEFDTLGIPTYTDWDMNRWGAELALTPLDLWLAAEFMGGTDDTTSLMTYYAEVAWMFKLGLDWFYGIQPAFRYEAVDPDTDTTGDAENIITAGINCHFLPENKVKLALCYRMIGEEETAVDNDEIIAQFQLKF